MQCLRNPGPFIFTIVLSAMLSTNVRAQSHSETTPSPAINTENKVTTEESTQQVEAIKFPED